MPSRVRSGPRSILFWLSGLPMMTCAAASGPIRFGRICEPPQPGISPIETSGRPSATALADTVR